MLLENTFHAQVLYTEKILDRKYYTAQALQGFSASQIKPWVLAYKGDRKSGISAKPFI